MSIATKSAIATIAVPALGRMRNGDASSSATGSTANRADGPGPIEGTGDDRPIRPPFAPRAKSTFGGDETGPTLSSADSRYVRFVEAVQALRLDREFTTLPPARVDRLMASAEDIFMIGDGIPRQVRPIVPPTGLQLRRPEEPVPDAAATEGTARVSGEPPGPTADRLGGNGKIAFQRAEPDRSVTGANPAPPAASANVGTVRVQVDDAKTKSHMDTVGDAASDHPAGDIPTLQDIDPQGRPETNPPR